MTSCSMSIWMAHTTMWVGMMVSFLGDREVMSKLRDKALGLMFLDPGRYVRQNLNRAKKSAQRACLGLRCLAVVRYSKFLWSVQTIKGVCAPSSQCRHSSRANLTASSLRLPMS